MMEALFGGGEISLDVGDVGISGLPEDWLFPECGTEGVTSQGSVK